MVNDSEFELIWYFLVGDTSNDVKQKIEKETDQNLPHVRKMREMLGTICDGNASWDRLKGQHERKMHELYLRNKVFKT